VPLFDPENPSSCELEVAHCLANKIAALTVYQELAGLSSSEDAREKIVIGPQPGPNNGVSFEVIERENTFIYTQIYRVNGSFAVRSTGMVGSDPYQMGQLQIDIKRLARESEQVGDVDVFFWDRVSQLAFELQKAVDAGECGKAKSILSPDGPWRTRYKLKESQGEFLEASLVAEWGDVEEFGS
jgi:hypothetical protein